MKNFTMMMAAAAICGGMVMTPAMAENWGGGDTTNAAAGAYSASQSSTSASQDSSTSSGAGAVSGGSQSSITTNNYTPANTTQEVRYSGSYTMKNTPNVVAPALTTTLTETCMGSTSMGASGSGFGVSFGTTWRDTACVRRLDSRQILALGHADAATELMCDSEAVAAAFRRVGRPCAADRGSVAAAPRSSAEYGMARSAPKASKPAARRVASRSSSKTVGAFGY